MIEIRINGQPREVPEGTTLDQLVASLGLQPRFVAVELNERLAPRAEHARRRLEPGDRVEIVTLVGGG